MLSQLVLLLFDLSNLTQEPQLLMLALQISLEPQLGALIAPYFLRLKMLQRIFQAQIHLDLVIDLEMIEYNTIRRKYGKK